MRRIVRALWFATAAVFAAASAHAAPQRVMSINLCSDQLVLDLLPRDRIVSVSWLAREGYGSYLAEAAAQIGINHGTAEEVVAQKPDFVVTGTYSAPMTTVLLKRVGMPFIELAPAEDFDGIRETLHVLGRVLGAEEKAASLVREMDATLDELAATAPKRHIVVAGWDGSGQVPGPKTLFNAILTAAGGVNIAASHGGAAYMKFDLEQLLKAQPDLIAFGDAYTAAPSIRSEALQHPLLRKLYSGRQITYPELLYSCGLPQSAMAAKELRKAMLDRLSEARR
jgi:iron complex transport system substrate-binding protein